MKKLKKEIEFHFNIRKFRLYYYDDDQQVFERFEASPGGQLGICNLSFVYQNIEITKIS